MKAYNMIPFGINTDEGVLRIKYCSLQPSEEAWPSTAVASSTFAHSRQWGRLTTVWWIYVAVNQTLFCTQPNINNHNL